MNITHPVNYHEWISETTHVFCFVKKNIQHKKTTWNWDKTKNRQNTSGIPEVLLAFPSSPLGYPNLGALDNKPPKAPAAEEDITSVFWSLDARGNPTRNKNGPPLRLKKNVISCSIWGCLLCSPFFVVAFSERHLKIRMENYVTQFRLGHNLIEKLQSRQCGISPVKASKMNVTWSKRDCKMIGSN